MFKFWSCIKKELLILFNDKVGLSLMFGLPIALVFLMTIIQDSAFKIINENRMDILISNQDEGELGKDLIDLLSNSDAFNIEVDNQVTKAQIGKTLFDRDKLVALYIPGNFSQSLEDKASAVSEQMLFDLGISENEPQLNVTLVKGILFLHDPVLQENYANSILSLVYTFLGSLEQSLMVSQLYDQMGVENPESLEATMNNNRIEIEKIVASSAGEVPNPNSAQHNVPAWTIFAMFFMVLSLGSNITFEKNSGSFIRLKTTPTHFGLILTSKMGVYILASILQVAIIFSIGHWVFPFIGLPQLNMPSQTLGMMVMILLTSLAAVSYAVMIGTIAKTPEQNNGIGSISIMIFAALGGIWVPLFALPEYMVYISYASPMRWCLQGFYSLFLTDSGLIELWGVIISIILFIIACQLITVVKLKREKLI